jgi:hypothetical protein
MNEQEKLIMASTLLLLIVSVLICWHNVQITDMQKRIDGLEQRMSRERLNPSYQALDEAQAACLSGLQTRSEK